MRERLFAFDPNNDSPKDGQVWYSYPSFITPGEPDAHWGVEPHTMFRRKLTFALR